MGKLKTLKKLKRLGKTKKTRDQLLNRVEQTASPATEGVNDSVKASKFITNENVFNIIPEEVAIPDFEVEEERFFKKKQVYFNNFIKSMEEAYQIAKNRADSTTANKIRDIMDKATDLVIDKGIDEFVRRMDTLGNFDDYFNINIYSSDYELIKYYVNFNSFNNIFN